MKTIAKISNAVLALVALVTVSSCHLDGNELNRICNEPTVGVNTTEQGDDVDGLCDGTISCTIRKAIYTANHSCVTKTIVLGTGVKYTITTHETGHDAASSEATVGLMAFPPITGDVIIEGNGAIIERDTAATDLFRLFYVKAGGKLTLRNVTIQGGRAGEFGASTTNEEARGGALLNEGELVLENASFSYNKAWDEGGAVYNKGTLITASSAFKYNHANGTGGTNSSSGGAIFSNGAATLNSTWFFENNGGGREGGALAFESSFVVNNCLFERNTSSSGGFAVYSNSSFSSASGSITNCTFYQNYSSGQDNGVIAMTGAGTLNIAFCTFSHNLNGGQFGNCLYLTTPSIANVSNCIFDANLPHNIFPEPVITFSGTTISNDNSVTTISHPSTNPMLGPLEMHSGFTKTMVPLTGSPAIDAVADCGTTTTDQRGNTRPLDGNGDGISRGDAGAVEVNP